MGQALQLEPRLLGISLQKNLTLLDLSFFIFFMQEKNNNLWCMPLFVFLFFSFLSILPWIAHCRP